MSITGANGQHIPYFEALTNANSGFGEMKYAQKMVESNYNFLNLRPINKNEVLNTIPPSLNYCSSKNPLSAQNDLLYKIFRGDTKLVRSILEANKFQHTESHEWNVLWSCGSCKAYLYEGLNEYQKINHFPQSYEITRKDRLSINVAKM